MSDMKRGEAGYGTRRKFAGEPDELIQQQATLMG
jgi:hypothetical protein